MDRKAIWDCEVSKFYKKIKLFLMEYNVYTLLGIPGMTSIQSAEGANNIVREGPPGIILIK